MDTEQALVGFEAKTMCCPHCGAHGTLNAHGWLRGYAEVGSGTVLRGRRYLCSNRHRRNGCGRTWSVRIAAVIAGFITTTSTLEHLLRTVVEGGTRKAAWECLSLGGLSLRSGYRLWQRLERAQSRLRTRLCRICPPPQSGATLPLAQFLAHLDSALGSARGVLARLQLQFQAGLFA